MSRESTPQKIEPMLISIKETARHLGGTSVPNVYKLIAEGRLATVKIGARRLVRLDSLKALIDASAA